MQYVEIRELFSPVAKNPSNQIFQLILDDYFFVKESDDDAEQI